MISLGNPNEYWLTRWLFQRALAVIYVVGFATAVNQFRPLLGTRGLTPVPFFLSRVSFWQSPSLFQIHYSDGFATILAWMGLLLALFALGGWSEHFGTPVSAAVWASLWVLYLSFVNVGQTWYSFGWESLLLEVGFLAIFLGARDVAPPVIVIWMLRWVLFRLMFGAGLIKIRGDACWRDLTCLVFHYQTQPIPNPLSWFLHRMPVWLHKAGVMFNHVAELVVPFGYFVPWSPIRYAAGIITIAFQGSIILSGNLSWLNWLTIVLAISCFDDRLLSRIIPLHAPDLSPLTMPHTVMLGLLTLAVVVLSVYPVRNMFSPSQVMNASFEPFHLVNTYGAFGSVGRRRTEVIMEGTDDSVVTQASAWKEYAFKAKPGDPARRPPIVAPYHLRLDWLMWFAGINKYYADPWMLPLVARLLQGDRATLGLMGPNPFPTAPPRWIRARLYEYRFTTAVEKRETGRWWERSFVEEFWPPISLQSPGLMQALEMQGWNR